MNVNQAWQEAFKEWQLYGNSKDYIETSLKRYKKLNIDLEVIKSTLSQLHKHLDRHLLHPQILPLSLLLDPEHWNPQDSGINELALLQHHTISSLDQLLSSGILNRVLNGEQSLYGDLPPIPIHAYADGLNKTQRQIRRHKKISIFEHLATEGWNGFRQRNPIATGLDRYHAIELPTIKSGRFLSDNDHVLFVLDGNRHQAEALAVQGGWNEIIHCSLTQLSSLAQQLSNTSATWVTICHGKDHLACGALHALAETLDNASEKTVLTCDDVILHRQNQSSIGYEHRQYRSAVSPIRLLSRGGIGGLLTVSRKKLKQCTFRNSYTCLEAFRLDCLLQISGPTVKSLHCHRPLVKSNCISHPCLPEQGWPCERHPFNQQQLKELTEVRERYCQKVLSSGATLRPNPLQLGCHDLQGPAIEASMVSIIIPFRDKIHLSKTCLESIQAKAGTQIPYEIILIDNGSAEELTQEWLKTMTGECNIHSLRIDEPFNYSRLNNKARSICKGSHLLFLNNDIEFCSDDVLQQLLAPFCHPQTAAVGSRLNYPDGSIQHQGVVIVPGERRCVLEPGKHLNQQEVITSLLPLQSQEEFSAASAACLMVKANLFDAIGGFDEKLAVVFNDVDLCLRLRQHGGRIVVTPHPVITHHESISRGKDQIGAAWSRHQRESGRLRLKHQNLYQQGDPLTSPLLHHHSTRYEPAPPPETPLGPVREQVIYSWKCPQRSRDQRIPLIFAQYGADPESPIRPDILDLLGQYRRFFHVQVVAATPALLNHPRDLNALKKVCDGLIIRRNEGYDYGSWMTGIRFCKELIKQRQQFVICNDSFWGPVRPLEKLINKLHHCTADVVGLTDNLMYEPHLQSPFLMFKERVVNCSKFWTFWDNIKCWENKRSIIKNYEVGLPALLMREGLKLKSLYSKNANGNILHSEWKSLIRDQDFPFLKVSLLRDNPHQIDISDWNIVVDQGNRSLSREIRRQLKKHYKINPSPET